jgi:hypothetical protein
MGDEIKYTFTYDELFKLLKHVYQEGYSQADIVEAGLESYDPDTVVRWILLKELKR